MMIGRKSSKINRMMPILCLASLLGGGMAALPMPHLWGLGGQMAFGQGMVSFPVSHLDIMTQAGPRSFTVEVAKTPDQLSQGLMYRRTMAPDAGMLFDFGETRPVSMWMKNTLIPLDMLFVTADGRVAGIAQRAVPESLAVISSPVPVRSVIELNGGAVSRLGIAVGDQVKHPMFPAP